MDLQIVFSNPGAQFVVFYTFELEPDPSAFAAAVKAGLQDFAGGHFAKAFVKSGEIEANVLGACRGQTFDPWRSPEAGENRLPVSRAVIPIDVLFRRHAHGAAAAEA